MKTSNPVKLFILSFIVLSGNAVLGYALYQSNRQLLIAEQWVQHTHQVISQSEKTWLAAKEIEADTRGFVITGDSSFIKSLSTQKQAAAADIIQLKKLTRDNIIQQYRIDSLYSSMNVLMSFSFKSVDLREKEGLAPAVTYISSLSGQLYMSHVHSMIDAIQIAENSLLIKRNDTDRHREQIFTWLSKAMFCAMLGFTTLMLLILGKYLFQLKDKRSRASELLIANAELIFQNIEKENRAAELIIANKELLFQNEEKENRAAELVLANIELGFQNREKENRAAELNIANEELLFQNQEKENRAAELIIANLELAFQNEEKEKRAADLSKVNHLYAFISQISQNILHVKDERALFHNACRIALQFGAFKLAWVGLFEDGNQSIKLIHQIGIPQEDMGHFSDIALQASIQQAHVLQTGRYHICNHILDNSELESWKLFTVKQGVSSCIILPVKKDNAIIGTFNLYATELDFFNKEEVKLLLSLTDDISFALSVLEKTKKQREAEELVVANEKRFRALIEKSTDMLMISTQQGELLYSSPSIKKVLGYTLEELKNQVATQFIHPDDIDAFIKNRMTVSQTPGQALTSQQRVRHKDGHWVWCEGTDNNLLEEPGIHAIVSNFREITERKILEQQQEFDGNNLAALINNTNDLMWSIDKDFNLITSNKPFDDMVRQMSGREIEKGNSVLSEQFPPEQVAHFKWIYERAFAGETFSESEYSPPPFEIWTDTSYSPIRKGDEIIGTACHSRNITEIKYAEETLNRSEKRLKEAQAIAHIGNFEINLAAPSDVWSDGMYDIFGISKKDVIPSRELFLSFIHAEDLETVIAHGRKAYQNFEDFHYDFRFIPTDGSLRYGHIEAKFGFGNNHKPVRLFGILQDVTAVKLAELERLEIVNDLMMRNRDLEQFAYIISHNLRAPVANIIGASDALNGEDLNIADREILTKGINVSVKKLDAVVQDLNVILQIKSKVNENKEKTIFSDLVEDIKISIRNLIDKYSITIRYDFSAVNELVTLKPYLYSIFYNLISNSVKYRQQDVPCVIEVISSGTKNNMKLAFSDNGLGIDLKKKGDDVFGLYKQFHQNSNGRGIGLYMVKTQVEALGGKINIQSHENMGTVFEIEFDQAVTGS